MGPFSRYGMRDLRAIAAHELPNEIAPLFSRNQLAQYGTDRGFKGIPSAGQPQAGKAIIQRGKKRILREALGDEERIGIQIEHCPDATDYLEENLRVRGNNPEF